MLACGSGHGGIVRVLYDPESNGYTSTALLYPDDPMFTNFRIGLFAYHYKNDHFVGTMAGSSTGDDPWDSFHVVAITPDATAIEMDSIFELPGTAFPCGDQFEVGSGHHYLVFMPNGVLHVFTL